MSNQTEKNEQEEKATYTYVVDDLEGNYDGVENEWDNLHAVFKDIQGHLLGEYDDEEGKVGDVPTKRIKKIEIWINQDCEGHYEEGKTDLAFRLENDTINAYYKKNN